MNQLTNISVFIFVSLVAKRNAGVKRRVKTLTTDETQLVPMGILNPNIQASLVSENVTDYIGNLIYENGVLSKILTSEGYITATDNKYHYYLKDHLGNIRIVFNENGEIEESNHYYPFGMLYGESVGEANNKQPYKYNGKELQTAHGLNLHDYGARHYDAALGRWGTIDPLAEKYYSVSPYVYALNNPARFIDPDGREVDYYNKDKVKNAENEAERRSSAKFAAVNNSGASQTKEKQTTMPQDNVSSPNPKAESATKPIPKTEKQPPMGEIRDANMVKRQEFHNNAMSTELGRTYLSNPVFKSVAVGGLGVTTVAATGAALPVLENAGINAMATGINAANAVVVGTQNATSLGAVLGIGAGVGFIQNALPYDAPRFSINPAINVSSEAVQILLKAFEIKKQ